jgi:hypothetical protein
MSGEVKPGSVARPRWNFHDAPRALKNLANRAGSIHDDAAARSVGFEGGFVPGSTVGTAALGAVWDRYGSAWLEGGWYAFKFVTPVYVHNEVRVLGGEGDADAITLRVETEAGRLCCSGVAGLGDQVPWNPGEDGSRQAGEVLPAVEIGLPYGGADFAVQAEDTERQLEAAGETSAWFGDASPWGDPVVPPEQLMPIALHLEPPFRPKWTGVRGPGMWSAHWLSLRQPLFLGRTYHI